jgi:hypothetical protein
MLIDKKSTRALERFSFQRQAENDAGHTVLGETLHE